MKKQIAALTLLTATTTGCDIGYNFTHNMSRERFQEATAAIKTDGFGSELNEGSWPNDISGQLILGRCALVFSAAGETNSDGHITDVRDYVVVAASEGEGKFKHTTATVTIQNAEELTHTLNSIDCTN